ncbi:MAG: ABC transporter ATP-binding protein [Candidatus Bathyarchaeia archaeon]
MATVKVCNLTKKFGNKIAVDHLSFKVSDGEFFCILGPPGAGKTTILRMIAGLEKPDEGEIYIDEQLVNDVLPADRDIAMTFQSLALYPQWTVYDNIAFPLRLRKYPADEIDKKVKEVASLLKITHLLNRTPVLASGGEKQRIAVARALVRSPKVLLLDEPLSNIDALLRLEMRGELKRLQTELKQTIIYATPDQLEAMSMADRIAVMNAGKLQQIGTPDEVYNKPANKFVASYIGSPTINFIDCTLTEKNGHIILDAGEFTLDLTNFESVLGKELYGQEMLMGIRPENVQVSKERAKNAIEGKVVLVEPLGRMTVTHIVINNILLQAICPEDFRAEYGSKVWVKFDMSRLHLFDKNTEKAII